jgi:hypothetical protein
MPTVRYGGENGKTVQLEVNPNLVAVRARRGRLSESNSSVWSS